MEGFKKRSPLRLGLLCFVFVKGSTTQIFFGEGREGAARGEEFSLEKEEKGRQGGKRDQERKSFTGN